MALHVIVAFAATLFVLINYWIYRRLDEMRGEFRKEVEEATKLQHKTNTHAANTDTDTTRIADGTPTARVVLQVEQPHSSIPRPPERSMPINIRTRGDVHYQQIGTLSSLPPYGGYVDGETTGGNSTRQILPLYGKPTYNGSSKWLYYTSTDGYHMMQIPVFYRDRDCSHEFGCEELSDGDEVYVREYGRGYRVALYDLATARYIPYI